MSPMKIGVWSILISGEGTFRGPQAEEFGGSVEYKEEWSEVGRDPGRGGRGEQDRGEWRRMWEIGGKQGMCAIVVLKHGERTDWGRVVGLLGSVERLLLRCVVMNLN